MACLAVNLAVNAWAIPGAGAEGAAIALCASEAFFFAVLLARSVLRLDVRLGFAWAAYFVPAALLAAGLWMLADFPLWQVALACAWAPVSLAALVKMPAQKACRESLERASQWKHAAA